MLENNENMYKEKQSPLDYYKNMLKNYVIDNSLSSQLPQMEIELEKYIAIFSLYIRHTNEAYKYNLLYLTHQHQKFANFMISASKKSERLRKIVEDVKNSTEIKKIITDNATIIKEKDIKLSLNDFLTADLSGNICFHKEFSLLGGERTEANDIITINYQNQVRSKKLFQSEQSQITKMLEKILRNSLESRGEDR